MASPPWNSVTAAVPALPPSSRPSSVHSSPPPGLPTPPPGYRRQVLWLTLALLLVWAAVTFGVAYFARELSFDFFGWPFSFWVGAQGALIVYCVIVWFYARVMNRRDAEWLALAQAQAQPESGASALSPAPRGGPPPAGPAAR